MDEIEKRREAARKFLYSMQMTLALRDLLDDLLGNLETGYEYWIKAENIIEGKVVITEAEVDALLIAVDSKEIEQ